MYKDSNKINIWEKMEMKGYWTQKDTKEYFWWWKYSILIVVVALWQHFPKFIELYTKIEWILLPTNYTEINIGLKRQSCFLAKISVINNILTILIK